MAKRRISKKSVRKIKRRRKRSTRRQRGGDKSGKVMDTDTWPRMKTFLEGILKDGDDNVYREA